MGIGVAEHLVPCATSFVRAASSAPIPTTGLQGWWDAADASTFAYSSGNVVSQWRDKSGLNRHFAQATVSLQPTRSGTQNGLPTLVFDGVDDYLDTAAFTVAQPGQIFIAGKFAANAVTQGWLASVGGSFQIYVVNANVINLYCGGGIGTAVTDGLAHSYTFTLNSTTSGYYIDGVSKVSGNAGASFTTTGLRTAERNLTAGYRVNGQMFEVVVYNRVLTTPEQQQVESYLRTKWGTP